MIVVQVSKKHVPTKRKMIQLRIREDIHRMLQKRCPKGTSVTACVTRTLEHLTLNDLLKFELEKEPDEPSTEAQ